MSEALPLIKTAIKDKSELLKAYKLKNSFLLKESSSEIIHIFSAHEFGRLPISKIEYLISTNSLFSLNTNVF